MSVISRKSQRRNNIDALRFVSSLIIVYYHILHSNIMDFVGDNAQYQILQGKSGDAGCIVEMFLIIAGFFLYYSYSNHPQMGIMEFILSKLFRLWPVLFFSIAASSLLYRKFSYASLLNVFLLQCIGISMDYKGINWYVSPFFWSLILYYVLLKSVDSKKQNIVIPLMVYFSYVINLNYTNGGFGRETIYNVFSLGFLRCIAGIGLGYCLGRIIECLYVPRYRKIFHISNKVIETIVYSTVEVVCFAFTIYYTVCGRIPYSNKFVFVIVFSTLFVCFVLKKGILSKLLDHKLFGKLGQYTYAIYVMQQFSFDILKRTMWKNRAFVSHESICLLFSIGFAIAMGIGVFYIVERPCIQFYKRRMNLQ